jgi:hypothetical protein
MTIQRTVRIFVFIVLFLSLTVGMKQPSALAAPLVYASSLAVLAGTANNVSTLPVGIGAQSDPASSGDFSGWMEDARIYSRTLTDNEIKVLAGSDPHCTPPSGIVGCWRMEEGSGAKLIDGSGLGNDANIVGSPSWVVGARGGLALQLDGSTQFASVPDSNSVNYITLVAWVKPGKIANQEVMTKVSGSSGYALSLASSGLVNFILGDGSKTYKVASTNTYLKDGSWTQIVGTFDGTTMTIYKDGQPESSLLLTGAPKIIDYSSKTDMGIGGTNTGGNLLMGAIDDLRIYDHALSATEVSTLFGAPTSVNLASFNGAAAGNMAHLNWQTATEEDLVGFNLYRSATPSGKAVKINSEPIPAKKPGQLSGASYEFADPVTSGPTYYYRLELVKTNGNWPGPQITVSSGGRIYLPLMVH